MNPSNDQYDSAAETVEKLQNQLPNTGADLNLLVLFAIILLVSALACWVVLKALEKKNNNYNN